MTDNSTARTLACDCGGNYGDDGNDGYDYGEKGNCMYGD